jgi:multicomponent K+:H+ antiporter subunit E
MSRLFPAPLLSVALFAMWLVLDAPPNRAQVVLALAVAIAVPIVVAPLRPRRARLRAPATMLKLLIIVLRDALVSNLKIALALLRRRDRLPAGAFVRVPLELDDPSALAALAVITTLVPGTVWCELAHDRSAVLIHVFELDDEQAFVQHYKEAYERPLKEIYR